MSVSVSFRTKWQWPIRYKMAVAYTTQNGSGLYDTKWQWPIRYKMAVAYTIQNGSGLYDKIIYSHIGSICFY
jgi:hypothetical protein